MGVGGGIYRKFIIRKIGPSDLMELMAVSVT